MWSSFFAEKIIVEGGLAFSSTITVVKTEYFDIGICWENFNLFYTTAYYGAYYFSINSGWNINDKVRLENDLAFYQSGSLGFTSTLYGIGLRTGLKISW
jgi:hypothetical protein